MDSPIGGTTSAGCIRGADTWRSREEAGEMPQVWGVKYEGRRSYTWVGDVERKGGACEFAWLFWVVKVTWQAGGGVGVVE